MHALILAAGFGTRLRPFTDSFPKSLVPIHGVPLIFYILANLKKNGISDVVINLHHHGDKIVELLEDGQKFGFSIQYSHEEHILGTGGGIKKALNLIDGDCLVINGDVIVDFDLNALISHHQKIDAYVTFLLYQHNNSEKYGLLYHKDGKIQSILDNPKHEEGTTGAMYASYHILSKSKSSEYFAKKPEGEKFCIMRDVYIPELLNKKTFGAYETQGFIHVCDSLTDVKELEGHLTNNFFTPSYREELITLCNALPVDVPKILQ